MTILNQLKEVSGLENLLISQGRPEQLIASGDTEFPVPILSWEVTNNVPAIVLDKTIAKQDIEVTIDLWTNDSAQGENLLEELEQLMRVNSWLLVFSTDLPDPSNISHINTKFIF